MLKELIETYEELKKYVFIINRGTLKPIVIQFKDENFFHLVGLHKININMFFPEYIKTKARKYTYMKKHLSKYNEIILNQIQEKDTISLRIDTFTEIFNLLKEYKNTALYDLKVVLNGSMYKGDYGLLKMYELFSCLLGLKINFETIELINCVPQSWMADTRVIRITEFKRPLYMESINIVPIELINKKMDIYNL